MALVLAYRMLGLGDLLTAVPALRALRRSYPGDRLVLATSPWLFPFVQATNLVDGVVSRTLPEATIAVNLHGKGPQSQRALLATSPDRVIAFGDPGPAWDDDEHEVERWCRLLGCFGIDADPTDLDLDPDDLALPLPPIQAPLGAVVVHPGASTATRRWPPDRWAAVARTLEESGVPVVVTGSAVEEGLAAYVAENAGLPPHRVLAGRTTLPELAAVVVQSSLVLCGDTGIGHLATALRRPSVVLFGPVAPAQWGPPPDRTEHIALHAGPDITRISESEVLEAIRSRLVAVPLP
jgi:ADP-heptose:LPS heptosyltransferase